MFCALSLHPIGCIDQSFYSAFLLFTVVPCSNQEMTCNSSHVFCMTPCVHFGNIILFFQVRCLPKNTSMQVSTTLHGSCASLQCGTSVQQQIVQSCSTVQIWPILCTPETFKIRMDQLVQCFWKNWASFSLSKFFSHKLWIPAVNIL